MSLEYFFLELVFDKFFNKVNNQGGFSILSNLSISKVFL